MILNNKIGHSASNILANRPLSTITYSGTLPFMYFFQNEMLPLTLDCLCLYTEKKTESVYSKSGTNGPIFLKCHLLKPEEQSCCQ